MKRYYPLLLLFSLFLSCQAPEKIVVIDNSGTEDLMLVFDDAQRINLGPGQTKEVKLQFGKRKMKINNEAEEEIYLDAEQDYIISPLKGTYYIETVRYFTSKRAEERYYDNYAQAESEVEGITVTGDFRKVENQVLVKKTWQYGLDSPISSSVKLSHGTVRNKEYFTVGKIYRKEDLLTRITSSFTKQLEEELKKQEKKEE